MKSIIDLTLEDLESEIKPKFRAKQIFNWLYIKYELDFDKMLNLSKDLRVELKEKYTTLNLKVINKQATKVA
jgi:23S rRNA (adenine2503-C2)-methyltransferase